MAWYDTKEHCPEEPCEADQKAAATEWNAMVTYIKDRICNIPLAAPVAGDDSKVISYNHSEGKFEYVPDCAYFETILPLIMNSLQTLTNTQADKAFIASNTRGATGLISTDDAKVQKIFLHLVGVATNTFAGENALDCTTGTHNQWQVNLDGGSYTDLVNGSSADGQMLDNDWKTYAQGGNQPFHFMFDVTSQISNIDGKIGITLQNGRSEQSSLNVTANVFLRVLWLM